MEAPSPAPSPRAVPSPSGAPRGPRAVPAALAVSDATRARARAGVPLPDNPARFPRNPVEWLPKADKLPPGLAFVMQRDRPGAKDSGSKEFSGFTSVAAAVDYARW